MKDLIMHSPRPMLEKLTGFTGQKPDRIRASVYVPLTWGPAQAEKLIATLVRSANSLGAQERKSFRPVEIDWPRIQNNCQQSLGIFWNDHSDVSLTSLQIQVPPRVVVGRNFHLKPLLADTEYRRTVLHLHLGPLRSQVSSVGIFGSRLLASTHSGASFAELLTLVDAHVTGETKYLGVSSEMSLPPEEAWRSTRLAPFIFAEKNTTALSGAAVFRYRLLSELAQEQRSYLEDFEEKSQCRLSELRQLILDGRLTQLVTSLEDLSFGEIDPRSGRASPHRVQLNTQDDNVLDDIVEVALSRGLVVRVFPKHMFQNGRTFLAS